MESVGCGELGEPHQPRPGPLLAYLADGQDDTAIAQRARQAGLAVVPLSRWRLESRGAPGLALGFTNIATADEARHLAQRLRAAVEATG